MMIPSQFDPAAPPVHSTFADDEDFAELLPRLCRHDSREAANRARTASSRLVRRAPPLGRTDSKARAGGYGFPELTEVAAELEQACKAQDADRITLGVDRVLDYLKRIAV